MEAVIRVRMMGDGRILARVEPLGPVAESDSLDSAVEQAREAHEAYLREHARWLPRGLSGASVRYRVIVAGGLLS
jgi:hypothetical protein